MSTKVVVLIQADDSDPEIHSADMDSIRIALQEMDFDPSFEIVSHPLITSIAEAPEDDERFVEFSDRGTRSQLLRMLNEGVTLFRWYGYRNRDRTIYLIRVLRNGEVRMTGRMSTDTHRLTVTTLNELVAVLRKSKERYAQMALLELEISEGNPDIPDLYVPLLMSWDGKDPSVK